MYKIMEAKTKVKYSEREKLKKWITFNRSSKYSEVERFEKLEDARKAFKKYKTDITKLFSSGETYFAVTEYMLSNDVDDDFPFFFPFLGCSPMQFDVVDKETYSTLKTCDTYAEAEAWMQENGDGRDLYISFDQTQASDQKMKKEKTEMNIEIPSQKEIIDYYGKEDRTTVVMEELAEFAKAVAKYKRYVLNSDKYKGDERHNASEITESLKEEIADTLICIRIMQEITGISDSEIEKEIRKKDERNSLMCRIAQLRDAQRAEKKK